MNWYADYEIKRYDEIPMRKDPSDDRKNLLLGVPVYGISCDASLEEAYFTEYYNSPATSTYLTDGKKCEKAHFSDPAFFHFSRGVGRTILFRLDYLSAVDEIKIGFLRQDDVAVQLPRKVDVRVSADGKVWQRVVKARDLGSDRSPERFELSAKLDKIYKTLYVMIDVEVCSHCWIDEIEAFGTEAIPASAVLPAQSDDDNDGDGIKRVDKYPEYSDFLGVKNLLLAYNCVPPEKVGDHHAGLASVEQYLPYLAYYDKDGKAADTFFDSFLYLPYSVYTYSKLYKCASGWKYYIDNTFDDEYNLGALDKAVSLTGEKLGIKNFSAKVFLTVLHTNVSYGEHPDKFGDVDGDGVDEDMSVLEDRIKAIKWCIDTQIALFKEKNYANLTLDGFYWFEEVINYSDRLELPSLKFARDYLHSLGLKIFWIPYFQARGFQDWKENGFDIACMQPNFAFRAGIPTERLYQNAELTKTLGMCVEMEIGGLDAEHVERFRKYMDCGAETGYMKSVKMYYQGGIPGEFYKSYKSDDPLLRSTYDDCYLFAKEKYVSRKDR